jgi:hypothetical protein
MIILAGAICPNGSSFLSRIAGSEWASREGTYKLQSCPPGYELVAAAEACHLCPAFSYCLGGATAHVTCPGGLFASPGSTSSNSCYKAIFTVISVDFPVLFNEILAANQADLQSRISRYAEVPDGDVVIDSISSVSIQSTRIIFMIASADIAREERVASKLLTSLASPAAFATEGLTVSRLNVIAVTACKPGYELTITASTLTGSDGTCTLCPASSYCVGGSAGRAACPTGMYVPLGANASSLCEPAVFVSVSVLLPIPPENFTKSMQQKFVQAVATTAKVPEDRVTITSIEPRQARRAGLAASLVKTQIAAADSISASSYSNNLDASGLNTALASAGLPSGSLTEVSIVSSVYHSTGIPSWVIAVSIVAAFIIVLVTVLVIAWKCLKKQESIDDRTLREKVTEIRKELKLTNQDGYYLTSERPSYWNRSKEVIYVRRIHIEAAARLALGQDFDVPLFDAFCLSLEGEKTENEIIMGRNDDKYLAVAEWLLEISADLIKPDDEEAGFTGTDADIAKCPPAAVRFRFFVHKVSRAKIWTEVDFLFPRLQRRANDFMNEIARQCDSRFACLCEEPKGRELLAIQPEGQQFEKFGAAPAAGKTRAYWRTRVMRSESNLVREIPGLQVARALSRKVLSPGGARAYAVLSTRQDGPEV